MSNYHFFAGDTADVVVIPTVGMSIRIENDRPMGGSKRTLAAAAASRGLEPGVATPGAQPSAAKPQDLVPGAVGDLMPWGNGNDFPQRITALYSKDPIIPTTLGKIAAMVQGQGIIAVLEDVDEDGDPIRRPLPANDPVAAKIRAFLTSRHFKQYMREMSSDATMYFNGWPECIISKNREEIVQLHPLNAEECRWCRMDDDGNLTHIYLDANWGARIAQQETSKKITALDPYRTDLVDWLRARPEYNCRVSDPVSDAWSALLLAAASLFACRIGLARRPPRRSSVQEISSEEPDVDQVPRQGTRRLLADLLRFRLGQSQSRTRQAAGNDQKMGRQHHQNVDQRRERRRHAAHADSVWSG